MYPDLPSDDTDIVFIKNGITNGIKQTPYKSLCSTGAVFVYKKGLDEKLV